MADEQEMSLSGRPSQPVRPSREVPVVWGNVPQRNKNFTGRDDLLGELRSRVTGEPTAVLAHAVHGMGGVGKTQLVIEYAYRYMGSYQVVWWIPADQVALVRSSLAALAPRLGLEEIAPGRMDEAVNAVLDALRRGDPYPRWLVVFDNADQPEELRDFMPTGPGHVIVTSRNHRWEAVTDVVEVDVFSRQESLEFLHRRVPGIAEDESTRLAEELGDLPLALEQAGALQVESGMSVDEYLELLGKESSKVLAESPPADYPVGVAAAWSLSVGQLRKQMPFAWELLLRCAFFGPEPIRRDLFKRGRYVLGPPLQEGLADAILLSRATRELGRYALARVDNNRKTLHVHRLIQMLIREELEPQDAERIRHEVHLLLAAADPDEPDDIDRWPRYEELLAHVIPSEALTSTYTEVRRLVRNSIQYLFNRGELQTCASLSHAALERWTADSGPDDVDLLILAGHRANLLWIQGRYQEAFELRRDTLERMRPVFGEDHEATLLVTNDHGADLRARGDFAAALELDEATFERCIAVFGDHPRTFMVAHNVAIDQKLTSDYEAALRTDTRTHQDRLDFFGRDDHHWVIHSLGAIANDQRLAGHYVEALQTEEQAHEAFANLVRRRMLPADHPWVLWQAKDLSVARRKMGLLDEALDLAEDVYQKYVALFGERHPDTLAAAMNLGNARRVYGDVNQQAELMEQAGRQVEAVFKLYSEVFSEDHPYTYGCALNLAIVLRRTGDLGGARRLLEDAYSGLRQRLGENHHSTLTSMTALATSLSETGDVQGGRELGERALDGKRRVLGADHPNTLACMVNLAIDLKALGENQIGDELATDALSRYRRVLPANHFDVQDAANGKRIAIDFEPSPL